ncbi:hypothetical protein [Nonomuraea cavernae]|uniref:hypothetical protein n=1 Tax=Nonomuraea cavernae TaxID=2045107 RepID=UPI0033E766D1
MTAAPSDDVIITRLLHEAEREFPGWAFTPSVAGWTTRRGRSRLAATSLATLWADLRRLPSTTARRHPCGWDTDGFYEWTAIDDHGDGACGVTGERRATLRGGDP